MRKLNLGTNTCRRRQNYNLRIFATYLELRFLGGNNLRTICVLILTVFWFSKASSNEPDAEYCKREFDDCITIYSALLSQARTALGEKEKELDKIKREYIILYGQLNNQNGVSENRQLTALQIELEKRNEKIKELEKLNGSGNTKALDILDLADIGVEEKVKEILVKLQDKGAAPRIYYMKVEFKEEVRVNEEFEANIYFAREKPEDMSNVKALALWVGENEEPYIELFDKSSVEFIGKMERSGVNFKRKLIAKKEGEHEISIGAKHYGPVLKKVTIEVKPQEGLVNSIYAFCNRVLTKLAKDIAQWVAILAIFIGNLVVLFDFKKRFEKKSSNGN